MKVQKTILDDHQVQVAVEVDAKQVEAAKHRAARKLAGRGKIPGFRPGKAPYEVIVRYYGDAAVHEQAMDLMVDDVYPEMLKEANIVPAAAGVLEKIDGNEAPVFTFKVPLTPEVSLGDYRAIRLPYKFTPPGPEKLSDSDPKVGQLVLALGRPGRGVQASWGIVTAIGGRTRTGRGGLLDAYIQSETTSYPGFSGGPLVNTEGEVLGLNTSGLTRSGALTIPAKIAWRTAEALAKHGTVKRGYLGVRTQSIELPESMRLSMKTKQEHGLLVLWLEEGGPAAAAGVLIGDILIGAGGQALTAPDDLFIALTSDTVGKSLPLDIVRGGKIEGLMVTVGERK